MILNEMNKDEFTRRFAADMLAEFKRASEKFPAKDNPTVAALTEEVGELAQAMLHIREGKIQDWNRVYEEAVQVATVAMRCALEGDDTLNVEPTTDNWK